MSADVLAPCYRHPALVVLLFLSLNSREATGSPNFCRFGHDHFDEKNERHYVGCSRACTADVNTVDHEMNATNENNPAFGGENAFVCSDGRKQGFVQHAPVSFSR